MTIAPPAGCAHRRDAGAHHLERGDDVEAVEIEKIAGVDRVEILVIGEFGAAGVVDQQVDPPPAREHGLRDLGRLSRGKIAADRHRILADLARQRLGGLAAVRIGDPNARALGRQRPHRRRADPAPAAGDDRDLAGKEVALHQNAGSPSFWRVTGCEEDSPPSTAIAWPLT